MTEDYPLESETSRETKRLPDRHSLCLILLQPDSPLFTKPILSVLSGSEDPFLGPDTFGPYLTRPVTSHFLTLRSGDRPTFQTLTFFYDGTL